MSLSETVLVSLTSHALLLGLKTDTMRDVRMRKERDMELFNAIYTRRSVRQFTEEPVRKEHLMEIVKAGTWAPSGLNNQPWRFATVLDKKRKNDIARQTKYAHIVEGAAALITVFVDRVEMYHEVKDHQAMGACVQNMLLAAHGLGLGAVWLGEILKNAGAVRSLLGLPERLELMAVVALGYPVQKKRTSSRKPLSEVLLKEM
jgi:nitroreductase